MTIIEKLTQMILPLTAGMLFFAMPAMSDTVAWYGSDGPVSAHMHVYNGRWPVLQINYRGHLFECSPWSYGRLANTVNIVYVVKNEQGDSTSIRRAMNGSCRNYWNYNEPEQAWTVTAHSDQDGLFQEIFRGQDLNSELLHIEVAFEAYGRWDSRYGANYHVWLERSGTPD